jgi:hypothetical protein
MASWIVLQRLGWGSLETFCSHFPASLICMSLPSHRELRQFLGYFHVAKTPFL